MSLRGTGSRSSLTLDELHWFSACTAFADGPPPRSPSSPIPIPSKRPSPDLAVGINDSLTLLRTKGLSRCNYQRSTKSSRAKASPSDPPTLLDTSSLIYKVPPLSSPSPPSSPVSSRQSKNPRSNHQRTPSSSSSSTSQEHSLPSARPALSKHPEWIYRRPKLSATGWTDCPQLPCSTSGPCQAQDSNSSRSNESKLKRPRHPPSPPSSFWSPNHKRHKSDGQTAATQWDTFDCSLPSGSPKSSSGRRMNISPYQPCRSASVSTASSSSSRPHTPPLQHYSPVADDIHLESYPRSILTHTSSSATEKDTQAASIMASRRHRSGSCSKSVKFVDIPIVHYASIDWDWVIPDEEDSELDSEPEADDEDEVVPSAVLGKFVERMPAAVDTQANVRTIPEGKNRSLKKLVGVKRHSNTSRKRTTTHPQKKPFISGPFALGTLPIPSTPSPPHVILHAVQGTPVSLRNAPSCDSFRSVKSSGGHSILSIKSLRSLPGSLKSGFKDWFTGR